MSCTWGGNNMHLCRRRKFQVTTLPLRTYASLTRTHHISFCPRRPRCSLILRDNADRAIDRVYSYPQRLHLRCVTRPALCGLVAWYTTCTMSNLHYVMCVDIAAKSSRVLQQQGSSLLFTMGYDSLHTPRWGYDSLHTPSYREPKLCEFGREIRIHSEPHGMAKV